jgi:hypothetical protein
MQIIDLKHAIILLKMGHTLKGECTGGIGKGKET